MSDPSGFPSGSYPQPIGTLSGGARSSNASGSHLSGTSSSTLPPATTFVAGQQFPSVSASGITNLAAAAAAAAAISSPKKQSASGGGVGGGGGGTGATKTGKRAYRKSGANSKRGGGAGGGGGGRGGAGSSSGVGRHGVGGGRGGGGGNDGDGKDSDDDEDEPEVSIEEQFILRLPPGEMCDRFREKVIAREIDESVNLKFKDSRRGTFTFEGLTFSTKLVDLPNIIEAQKTLNGKQMYKIADISQMLIVDSTPSEPEPLVSNNAADSQFTIPLPPMKANEYTWPDGLSMPLKNVRRRRFRKRVSKAAVEGVENEIDRLLHEDAAAEEVQYDIREQIDGMDQFDSDEGGTPAPGGHSDMDMDDDDMNMMMEEDDDFLLAELEGDMGDSSGVEEEEQQHQGGSGSKSTTEQDTQGQQQPPIQQQPPKPRPQQQQQQSQQSHVLQSGSSAMSLGMVETSKSTMASSFSNQDAMHIEIRNASGSSFAGAVVNTGDNTKKSEEDEEDEEGEEEEDEEDDEEEDDDDDDDSGSDEDEEEDEDDKEKAQHEKMLKDEIKELNSKVQENQDKLNSAPNEILKKRFGSILDNLRKELELKTMQLEESKDAKGKSKKA